MPAITLKAHYDGQRIVLDEQFVLPFDAQLLVTLVSPMPEDPEREAWYALSKAGLARAYGDDEPDYSADLVRRRPNAP